MTKLSRAIVLTVVAAIGGLVWGPVAPAVGDTTGPVPVLQCVDYDPSQHLVTAHFSYLNFGSEVTLSPADDYFSPAPLFRGQPLTFPPASEGTNQMFLVAWSLDAYPDVTWHLNGQDLTATKSSPPCINYGDAFPTLVADSSVVKVGDEVSYTLAGSFLTAAVTLPPGMSLVHADDVCSGTTTLTCASGATIVAAATAAGDATATAAVLTSDGPDVNPGNNTATATVHVSGPPFVLTGPSTAVGAHVATLTGSVDPQGASSSYTISYWPQGHSDQSVTTPSAVAGEGIGPVPVQSDVTGLHSGTTYEYAVTASNANGLTTGATAVFTTTPASADLQLAMSADTDTVDVGVPVTYTMTVTNAGPDDATGVALDVSVPGATAVTASPSCSGTDTLRCVVGALASGSSVPVTVTVTPSGVGPAVVTAVAAGDQADPHVGNNLASTRVAVIQAPAVTAGPTSSITSTEAVVTGAVTPNGSPTTYSVRYGTSTAYARTASGGAAGSGTAPVPVAVRLTGLTPGAVTHAQLVATNAAGVTRSIDIRFRTLPTADLTTAASAPTTGAKNKATVLTVTTRNAGPGAAKDVRVVLPASAAPLTRLTTSVGHCDLATRTCQVGSLAVGGTLVVKATYVPAATGPLTLGATSSAANLDPRPANNTVTRIVKIS